MGGTVSGHNWIWNDMLETDVSSIDELFTAIPDDGAENTMKDKYLVFFLDGQEFAITIEYIIDIINVQPITIVPNVPNYVRGITNLRGKVIPIIDMRLRFGKDEKEYNDRTCIIVVEVEEASVGLIIDQVSEVIKIKEASISPPPSFIQGSESRFIQGISESNTGIKLILDCQKVLDNNLPAIEPEIIPE